MNVWKVEVWIKIKNSNRPENWATEYVACDGIEEAIVKAKQKQTAEWKSRNLAGVEVRSASLELSTTIDEAKGHVQE